MYVLHVILWNRVIPSTPLYRQKQLGPKVAGITGFDCDPIKSLKFHLPYMNELLTRFHIHQLQQFKHTFKSASNPKIAIWVILENVIFNMSAENEQKFSEDLDSFEFFFWLSTLVAFRYRVLRCSGEIKAQFSQTCSNSEVA